MLRFRSSIDDLVDSFFLVLKKNPYSYLTFYVFPRILIPIVAVILIVSDFLKGDYVTPILIFIAWLCFQPWLYNKPYNKKPIYKKYKKLCLQYPYLLQEKNLSIKDDFLYFSYPSVEKSCSINQINYIIISNNKAYLYNKSYLILSIIPLDIFTESISADEFLTLISVNAEVVSV